MVPLFVAGLILVSTASAAQPQVVALRYSFDTATVWGAFSFESQDLAQDNLAGSLSPVLLGTLPSNAVINSYHLRPDGAQLFTLDTTVELPGLAQVRPCDIVKFDGTHYTLDLSGTILGIPEEAAIDALTAAGDGDLIVSFDIAVDLGGLVVEDHDLVRLNGSQWSLFFDGSAAGVPTTVDLDAADLLPGNDHLLLSFDTSGTVGGISFDDEDVLEYDPVGHLWSKFWDGSSRRPEIIAADLNALYAVLGGPSGLFSDGFESGDTSVWSGSRP